MIALEINWEQELKKAHQGRFFTGPAENIPALKRSLNSRIKEINKMIAAGTAVYREVKEQVFTVKDNTTGQEFTYSNMPEAIKRQEDLVHIIGHDAEILE